MREAKQPHYVLVVTGLAKFKPKHHCEVSRAPRSGCVGAHYRDVDAGVTSHLEEVDGLVVRYAIVLGSRFFKLAELKKLWGVFGFNLSSKTLGH